MGSSNSPFRYKDMSSDSPIYEAEPSDIDEDIALTTFHKAVVEYMQDDAEDEWEKWQ